MQFFAINAKKSSRGLCRLSKLWKNIITRPRYWKHTTNIHRANIWLYNLLTINSQVKKSPCHHYFLSIPSLYIHQFATIRCTSCLYFIPYNTQFISHFFIVYALHFSWTSRNATALFPSLINISWQINWNSGNLIFIK